MSIRDACFALAIRVPSTPAAGRLAFVRVPSAGSKLDYRRMGASLSEMGRNAWEPWH